MKNDHRQIIKYLWEWSTFYLAVKISMGAPAGGIERYFKRFLYRDQSGRLDCLPLISKNKEASRKARRR